MMKTPSMPYRCAIYFTPPIHSAWWDAGNQWLGRCLETNQALSPPDIPNLDRTVFLHHTVDPRRYGWHATLKAPFILASQYSITDLLRALQGLANDQSAFTMPPMRVSDAEGFISLRPTGDIARINSIASACVTDLHSFAAPLTESELVRRRKAPLTPHQDQLLLSWGYPWVLDQFRFHFSLTGPTAGMDPGTQDQLLQAAINHFGSLPPCPFEHLSLFIEPAPGADFQFVQQVELRG